MGSATCGSSCTLAVTDAILGTITAGSLTIGDTTNTSALDFNDSSRTFSKPPTLLSSGNVTLDSVVNDSYSGTALVIAAGGNFVNNVGSNPLNLTGTSPNWDIYSTGIQSDTNGAGTTGLSPSYTTYSATYAGNPPSGLAHPTSNNWLYSDANAGTITITATGQIVTYGTAPNTTATLNTTYSCSGSCADISGAPTSSISGSVTTSTSGNYIYGTWTNDILAALGSLSFNSGYTGSFSLVNGTLTVNKKGLTITGFAANNKTYDGTTNATISSNGSLSGVVGSDSVSLNTGSASATFDNPNVGTTHTVTASGYALSSGNGNNDANNYTLTQPTGSNVTISAAGLTITASNQTQTYGFGSLGTTGFSITSGQLFSSDAISGVTLATSDGTSTSGNYKYTATPATLTPSAAVFSSGSSGNYAITYDNAATGLTVNPATLTITGFAVAGRSYDGLTDATITSNGSLSGLVSGDSVSLNSGSASATFGSKNAGTETATASGYALSSGNGNNDANNYILTQPTANATISTKPITVTANGQSDTYGDTLGTLSYGNTGLATGDSFTGALTTAHGGAGTVLDNANGFNVSGSPFAITQGSLTINDGNGGNNYAITYNSANLTLAAKGLAVTADNESKTVGASDPGLNYTYSGLAAGDASASFTGGLTRDSGENVGDYTIRIGTLAATGNYTVGSYNPGVFSILAGSGGNDSLNAMQVAAIVLGLPPARRLPPCPGWARRMVLSL